MANTYASLNYHVIFSTKNRVPFINPQIHERLWQYLGGILRNNGTIPLQIGGTTDHIHALILVPPVLPLSRIVKHLKGSSSRWIHQEIAGLRMFQWQDGYGAFTVSKSQIDVVIKYIQNQPEHHRKKSFQEEYVELLKRHGIKYDERYLWD